MPGLVSEASDDTRTPTGCKPICYVNGKRQALPQSRAEVTLLEYLRGAPISGLQSELSPSQAI